MKREECVFFVLFHSFSSPHPISQVNREVRHLLPILLSTFTTIDWPVDPAPHAFERVIGAIDCTSHYRVRTLNAATFYRGDKRDYFLTAQVVCDLGGKIFDVSLLLGHNNDISRLASSACHVFPICLSFSLLSDSFELSGMRQFISQRQHRLLADRGYRHPQLVTPNRDETGAWRLRQTNLRSIIERVFCYVKAWKVASHCFRQNPELQAEALMAVYVLAAMILQDHPLSEQ